MMTIGQYNDLDRKCFLVTGASSGIGRSVALALGGQGAHLFLTGRDKERLRECQQDLESESTILPADLTVAEEVEGLVGSLPALDGICHAAGVVSPFPVRYLQRGDLSDVFEINYKAPALLTSSLLRQRKLHQGASVVFISSVASLFSYSGSASYSGSKAALEAFCRSVAIEHSGMRIRANCIQAAMVKTLILERTRHRASEQRLAEHEREYPLGFGTPEDVAEACLFLLSDASGWITGTSLVMDGGLTAHR